MSSQNSRQESFEWAVLPPNVPKNQVLKIVAKTPATTFHPEDVKPEYRKRIFPVKELELAARSLIGKSLYVDHLQAIPDSLIFRSEWNPLTMQVESLALAPEAYCQKVRAGLIQKASVKYGWSDERAEDGGTAFLGLWFRELSLLETKPPGDPGAQVFLAESKEGLMEAAVAPVQDVGEKIKELENELNKLRGEKSAPTTKEECEAQGGTWNEEEGTCTLPSDERAEAWEDTEEHIRSGHGDKSKYDQDSFRTIDIDADAGIQAVIGCPSGQFENGKCKTDTEVQSYLFSKEKGWTMEKAKDWFSKHKSEAGAEKDKKIKELEESITRQTARITELETSRAEAIDDEVQKYKMDLLSRVEAVIPQNFIIRQGNFGLRRLVTDLKKLIRDERA